MDGFSGSFAVDPDVPPGGPRARATVAGPVDREHFLDARRRHRRATWRAAAIGVPAVMVAGIPLCVVVTPILLAPAIVAAYLLGGLGGLAPEAGSWVYQATHLLPDLWSAIRHGTPISPAVLVATLVLPGAVTMLGVWLALRLLLAKAWIPSVLARLDGRLPDPGRPDERALCNIAEELAIAAAVPPPLVLLIDSDAANAVIVGHDLGEATLLVSTGLLDRLDRDETQAMVAHLIASAGNGDLRIAATFFSIFAAWGALSLLIETPFNREARDTLGRTVRALRDAAGGRSDAEEECEVIDALLDGAAAVSSGFEDFMEGANDEANPLRRIFVDLPLVLGSCLFAATARFAIALCTALIFGPPISGLWRSRRRLADAGAVELTRQPAALASAVEKLHGADVEVAGGEPISFLFPVWPKAELKPDRIDVGGHVLGMQLDPHKRLQGLKRLGSGREVAIALGGWEGWRCEIRDVPLLLAALAFALALVGFMFALSFAGLGALLWLLWTVLDLALSGLAGLGPPPH